MTCSLAAYLQVLIVLQDGKLFCVWGFDSVAGSFRPCVRGKDSDGWD